MNIFYTIASIIQFIAIWYLLQVSYENSRSFTLAKNSKWVSHNSAFLNKHRKPSGIALLLTLGALLSIVIFYLQTNALDIAWTVKNGGILIATIALSFYGFVKEKKIKNDIPAKTVRIATLQQRTLGDYIPKQVQILSVVVAVVMLTLPIISFGLQKITISAMVFDLLFALFGYVLCFGTIINTVRKKEPHQSELKPFTTEEITVHHRAFSIRIMTVILFLYSLVIAAFIVTQWSGLTFIVTPAISNVYGWFGETVPDALLSKYHWDMVVSFCTSFLIIGAAKSKSLQNYRSTKLYK